MLYTLSPALAGIRNLERFLDEPVQLGIPFRLGRASAMLGWGRMPSQQWAQRISSRLRIPCLALEDGFLRSVGFGRSEPPLSLVLDGLGIYYDANGPSRLETLIATGPHDPRHMLRAQGIMAAWRAGRLSKYNHTREWMDGTLDGPLPERFILVVDQTFGDASIRFGLAGPDSFRRMLKAALNENPEATILLKMHPEVVAGRKRGHFDMAEVRRLPRVRVLGVDVHPAGLLERAEAVYAVTSQMGFEALLWGKAVRTFGMPFYAGWGLTRDELAAPVRRRSVPLEVLVHAALVDYPRYVDPETGQRCEVERVMDYLAFQRRMRQRFPPEVHAVGFGRLRRPMAQAYFDGSRLCYHDNASAVPVGATVAVWGRDVYCSNLPEGARQVCMEDGFLRSVGLGAELAQPLSLIMDRVGIYYDPTRPSELELILQYEKFDDALLARAALLRKRIIQAGLTKYNVGRLRWQRPAHAGQVILVPGQVERDASIRFGSPHIKTNLDLLMAVRTANPDAYLIYKPHPDVQAGLRLLGKGEDGVGKYCNEVVRDAPMDQLLAQLDEVHVLTSLAGFEALLRGKQVVTYGQPFYAGWGLTRDIYPPERRSRRLQLDELVAGVLILYPTYVSRITSRFTTPERVLEELLAWREQFEKSSFQQLKQQLVRPIIALHAKHFQRK